MGKEWKRKRVLTAAQLEYRDSILRGKVASVKAEEKPMFELSQEDQIRTQFYYLNNCVFWVNEYIEGRVGKDQLLEAAKSIQLLGKKLQDIIQKP